MGLQESAVKNAVRQMAIDNGRLVLAREILKGIETSEENEPKKTYSVLGKYLFTFYYLSLISISYCKASEVKKIIKASERISNQFGITIDKKGESFKRCLTSHSKCEGYYKNPFQREEIKCECKCHGLKVH